MPESLSQTKKQSNEEVFSIGTDPGLSTPRRNPYYSSSSLPSNPQGHCEKQLLSPIKHALGLWPSVPYTTDTLCTCGASVRYEHDLIVKALKLGWLGIKQWWERQIGADMTLHCLGEVRMKETDLG